MQILGKSVGIPATAAETKDYRLSLATKSGGNVNAPKARAVAGLDFKADCRGRQHSLIPFRQPGWEDQSRLLGIDQRKKADRNRREDQKKLEGPNDAIFIKDRHGQSRQQSDPLWLARGQTRIRPEYVRLERQGKIP
jgi:hypothetical protein